MCYQAGRLDHGPHIHACVGLVDGRWRHVSRHGSRAQRDWQAPRVKLQKTLEQLAPSCAASCLTRERRKSTLASNRPRLRIALAKRPRRGSRRATPETVPTLDQSALARPFDYSAREVYLVAAIQDDGGLAIWEMARRKRLRKLEDSKRSYALVTISDDARWIAGVRQDDSDQIDLWRADNGRLVRVIQAAGGPKTRLGFESGNQLRRGRFPWRRDRDQHSLGPGDRWIEQPSRRDRCPAANHA